MNGSGKQSFYEIQLSNSSLVVAFLIAVGIGVAVFMLGVVVGRGQTAGQLPEGGFQEQLGTANSAPAAEEGVDTSFLEDLETDRAEPEAGAPPAAAGGSPAAEGGSPNAPRERTAPATGSNGLPADDPSIAMGYVVQVKATPVQNEATTLQEALARDGFPAFVTSAEVRGSVVFRVRVGRYRTESDAERVAAALSRRPDIGQTWVTSG